MATENIKVKVQVDTKEAERGLNSLRGAVGGLLGLFAGREIVQFGDSITSLQNKLRTLPFDNVAGQFAALTKIAISSRAPLAETGDLYFRIARNAKTLGISQLEAATITDTLTKAMSATGLSAQEAAGPLLQLGQALQSGRFQGDELRSILEGMPTVAQAMADSLGVTVGQLRELGSQGKLTADVFIKAMRETRDSVLNDFGKAVPTVSQAFETLRTASAIAFNEFETNSQTGAKFADSIEFIAFMVYKASKSMDEFIEPIGKVIKLLLALAAFTVIGKIFRGIGLAFRATTGAIKTFRTTFSGAMSSAKAATEQLSKTFSISNWYIARFIKGGSTLRVTLEALGKRVPWLITGFKSFGKAIVSISGYIVKLGAAIASFLGIDALIDEFNSFADSTSDNSEELAAFRAEMADFNSGLTETEGGLSDVAGESKSLAETQAELARNVAAARREIQLSAESYHRNVAAIKEQIQFQREQIGVSQEQVRMNEAVRDFNQSYADEERRMLEEMSRLRAKGSSASEEEQAQISELQAQLERLRASREGDLAGIRASTAALFQETQAFDANRAARQAVMDIGAQGQDFRARLEQQNMLNEAENELVKQKLQMQFEMEKANQDAILELRKKYVGQEIPAVELAALEQVRQARQAEFDLNYRAMEEEFNARRTFAAGWAQAAREATNSLAETVADQGAYAKRIFNTITEGFTNSIMTFVQTGKLSFKDLFKSLMAEIIKMQMNKLFLSIFGQGGPMGSLFAGLFAEGGRIPSGKYGIVGERGPELVRGPANVIGTDDTAAMMGGGGVTQVTYNISAVDSRSFKDLVAQDPAFIYNVTRAGARRIPR